MRCGFQLFLRERFSTAAGIIFKDINQPKNRVESEGIEISAGRRMIEDRSTIPQAIKSGRSRCIDA
jgi:hypothetical protein